MQQVIRDEQQRSSDVLSQGKLDAQQQDAGEKVTIGQGTEQRALQPTVDRGVSRAVRFLLRPVLPVARYFRRFLVQRIETYLDVLQRHLDVLQRQNDVLLDRIDLTQKQLDALQSRQSQLEVGLSRQSQQQFRLEVGLNALRGLVDDVGLRSRGALPVDDSTFALRTYDGFVLIPREDTQLLLMLLDAGPPGLEPGTRHVLLKLLTPGMTFVDVGANVGLLTLAGARAVGPSGKVLAIEPVPLCFELLNRSLAINELFGRVELKRQAAGARREYRKFFVGHVLGHSSLIRANTLNTSIRTEIEVEVSPLDDLVQQDKRVDVVKIDVEGAELEVLEGMTRIIADNPELAIIAEFGPSHLRATNIVAEKWFSAFSERGFGGFVIHELSGECRPVNLLEVVNVVSVNILFARYGSSALARALK